MPSYASSLNGTRYRFDDLKALLACASPLRSGDQLAGIAAAHDEQRVAARLALADLPLRSFLDDAVIPYEQDEVTRLIVDSHDVDAFAAVAHLTVRGMRDWLLYSEATPEALARVATGTTPAMVAAVPNMTRKPDPIDMAAKSRCGKDVHQKTSKG